MKQIICTVWDSKAEAYNRPLYFQSKGQAIRSFSDVCNDTQSEFWKHPEDYTLFQIGEFDEATGTLTPVTKKSLIGAWECKGMHAKSETAPNILKNSLNGHAEQQADVR